MNHIFLILMAFSLVNPLLMPIANPSFEEDANWTFYDNGEGWKGQYSNAWASDGTRSYEILIPGDSDCTIFPGDNTYGEIYQNVDFTGVDGFYFDFRTYSIWDAPYFGPDYFTSAEVWIDGARVYYLRGETDFLDSKEYLDQWVSTRGITGLHRLTIRMQHHLNMCVINNRGIFIDNLRVGPSPFSYLYLPFIQR